MNVRKILIPVLILGMGMGAYSILKSSKAKPEPKEVTPRIPPVEYLVAQKVDYSVEVGGEGIAEAVTNTVLNAEVSGRVEWISEQFRAGRFFKEGDLLLKVDPTNYISALAEAELRLANVRLKFAQEEALVEQARIEWTELGRGGQPSALTLREPQLEAVKAEIAAAEAGIAQARRNLDRTELKAPYDGRVWSLNVDLGQAVSANGTVFGSIYRTDAVEIAVPLAVAELNHLPEGFINGTEKDQMAYVRVEAAVGSEQYTWDGRLDRIEGTIDRRTRMVRAVVVVEDPYGLENGAAGFPLQDGLFVRVSIEGKILKDVFILPRGVMVRENALDVIAADNKLSRRKVQVVASNRDEVIVGNGIKGGERINLTPIDFFIEGMEVSPVEATEEVAP